MTIDSFNEVIVFLEDAYEIEFTDGTKAAYWELFQNRDATLMMRAAKRHRQRPELFRPHPGLLSADYQIEFEKEEDRRRQESWEPLDRSEAAKLENQYARIIRESVGALRSRRTFPEEWEACWLFPNLVEAVKNGWEIAVGAKNGVTCTPGRRPVYVLTVTKEAREAMAAIGDRSALKELSAHDILYAREAFKTAYLKECAAA